MQSDQTKDMSAVITAVSNVMTKVGSVRKEGVNQFHNYKFAQAADVLHKLQPLLAKEGLVIIQNELGREFILDGSVLAVRYEFTLAHKDGGVWPEKIVRTGMAPARNTKGGFDDKALNKCHTAARKYFHISLFDIPTGDYADTDADEDRAEIITDERAQLSDKQLEELNELIAEVGATPEKFCRYLRVATLDELPSSRFSEARAALESKRKAA